MVQQHRQNMYASHFKLFTWLFGLHEHCILLGRAGLKTDTCRSSSDQQLPPPHNLSIANSYLQDAKLPDLCILLPLELLFLALRNLQCGALHYICFALFCANKVHHISRTLLLITDPSQPNLHRL